MTEASSLEFDHHRGRRPLLRPTRPGRWGVFLAVNLLAFVVVNAFWRYVATGQWVDFTPSAYAADVAVPMGRFLVEPLSVFRYPWMILATGMLLACVIYIPVVVAVLYRLPFALPFLLIVALVGHAPLLALTVGVGCFLAARTGWRSDMPFLAALLGLGPAGVYFALAYLGVSSQGTLPLQRWLLMAPLVLALVLAVLASWPVLRLARWTGYRPGVVWPVLLALLVPPIGLFCLHVGPAELEYALIAHTVAPGESLVEETTLEAWAEEEHVAHLPPARQAEAVRESLAVRCRQLRARCQAYLRRHPDSDRAPEVLWLEAQSLSLRVSEAAIRQGLIRYSADHLAPTPECRASWQRLVEQYPRTPHAGLANWHMGELALRGGNVDHQAGIRLAEARARLRVVVEQLDRADRIEMTSGAFLPRLRLPAGPYWRQALFEVDRLIWLMSQNEDAPKALGEYLSLDRDAPDYALRLAEVAQRYPRTSLADNLALAAVLARDEKEGQTQVEQAKGWLKRIKALIPLATAGPVEDAAIEANYELGCLAVLTKDLPTVSLTEGLREPQWYFTQVIAARENPWQARARQRLGWLRATGQAAQTEESDLSEYDILTSEIASPEALLEPVILEEWARGHGAAGVSRTALEFRVREDLDRRAKELLHKGLTFLERFPDSRRCAAVAWLCAQVHGLRLDASALRQGLIRYGADHVRATPESRAAWERVRRDFAASPQSALAQWRLGELALRTEKVPQGRALLEEAERHLAKTVSALAAGQGDPAELPGPPYYRRALLTVRRLLWLLEENKAAPAALAALLRVDPLEPGYFQTLCALAREYEQTGFGDNLKLAVALAEDDPREQARALLALARPAPPSDAGIEAIYELGRLALRTVEAPSATPIEGLRDSAWYFRQVCSARVNPWQPLATEHLRAAAAAASQPSPDPYSGEQSYAAILGELESPRTVLAPVILVAWARRTGLEHLSVPELRARVRNELATRRDRLARRCEDFVDRYPFSLHAPKALFLAGRVLSTQVDEAALRVGLVKYRTDHLRDTLPVLKVWRRLTRDYPASRQAALARWHLAVLAVRHAKPAEAREPLAAAIKDLASVLRAMPAAPPPRDGTLIPADPMPDVDEYRHALAAARRLEWLMRENHVADNPAAAGALADLYDANPYLPRYAEHLADLARKHAATPLADNLRLAAALAREDDTRRAAALRALADGKPQTDAGIEACWELAWRALRASEQAPAPGAIRQESASYFRRVAAASDSPWKAQAAEQLLRLVPTTQPKGTP